jgi:hypothetical protein
LNPAIEFHAGHKLRLRDLVWKATTDANHDGRMPHLVLLGFTDSRIDTQLSFNIWYFSYS